MVSFDQLYRLLRSIVSLSANAATEFDREYYSLAWGKRRFRRDHPVGAGSFPLVEVQDFSRLLHPIAPDQRMHY